jgi:hypothetical protein
MEGRARPSAHCARRGCAHAPAASAYCSLVGGAGEAEPPDSPSRSEADDEHAASGEDGAGRASLAQPKKKARAALSANGPHACDEPGCHYTSSEASELKAHKRTHSGERPYACDEPGCDYESSEAGTLERHKRTHSGERPHACDEPGCDY